MRKALRLAPAALPPLILLVVILRLDTQRLGSILFRADWVWVLAVLPLGILVVASGAMRSRVILAGCGLPPRSLAADIADYWRSQAIGIITPGSLGADAYRVIGAGIRLGNYLTPAVAIMMEKLAALVACAALAAAALPSVLPQGATVMGVDITLVLVTLVACSVPLILALDRLMRLRKAQSIESTMRRWIVRLASRIADRSVHGSAESKDGQDSRATIPRLSVLLVTHVISWSLAALLISSLQAHLFFAAIGHPVPLAVNLLVTPLIFVVLALPLSVGSFGVRELAFIVLYGACGVPLEPAVVVSFCSLASVLLSQSVGSLLFQQGRMPH